MLVHTAHAELGVGLSGGQYRLCWCAGQVGCSTSEQFQLDFGELTLIGPSRGQDRTCIASRECHLNGLEGYELGAEDRLMVLETCSVSSLLEGYPSPDFALASSNWSASVTVTSSGGWYRLCWCMRGFACSIQGQFRVDVGSLRVLGPAPLQHRTCVSGRHCLLEGLTIYRSIGQSASDRMLVLETCGTSALLGVPRGSNSPSTLVNGAAVNLSEQMFYAPGGEYRLCWCSGQSDPTTNAISNTSICTRAQDFSVDMGSLAIMGPAVQQDRTCVAGQECRLTGLLGTMDMAALLVLETCGISVAPDLNRRLGRPGQPPGPTAEYAAGATFLWKVPVAPPGGFRLCWCADFNSSNLTHCAVPEDFQMDIGRLEVIGPVAGSVEQRYTCVSGRPCRLDGFESLGFLLGDRLLMLDTCAGSPMPDYLDALLVTGPDRSAIQWRGSALSAPGGQYRLCWCGTTGANASNATATPDDCGVDAGELTIIGVSPLEQHRTCISGQSCSVTGITGQSLSSEDAFMILHTCATDASVARLVGQAPASQGGGAVRWDSVPLSSAGGIYRLCWCSGLHDHNDSLVSCAVPTDFGMDVGNMYILGPAPLQQDRTCISGQSCITEGLAGHLSMADRYLALETCGNDLAAIGTSPGRNATNMRMND